MDQRLEENDQGARDAGMDLGFYYYVTAKIPEEGRVQAKVFADLIGDRSYTLRPAIDFEDFTGLSIQVSNETALAFLQILVEETSVTPTIYTDTAQVSGIEGQVDGDFLIRN